MAHSQSPALDEAQNRYTTLYQQGRYSEAISYAAKALRLGEEEFGPGHPTTATFLNDLALLYQVQGNYAEAAPLYRRSLAIWEKALGPDHPDVALSLNNLAGLYQTQGNYAEAAPLYQRSLAIREKALGPEHPDVAGSLNNLAALSRLAPSPTNRPFDARRICNLCDQAL
jgi:tetratricopeptide (TPR) repeat protein